VNLDLTDVGVEALLHELDHIIDGARFPLSPRILTLKAIRAKLRPEPVREPLPRRGITTHRVLAEGDGGRGV
jgi:hypothetical protein